MREVPRVLRATLHCHDLRTAGIAAKVVRDRLEGRLVVRARRRPSRPVVSQDELQRNPRGARQIRRTQGTGQRDGRRKMYEDGTLRVLWASWRMSA